MTVVYLAIIELLRDPTLRVFSNFKINAPRCFYLPYLFADFEKMKNCIFIIDDVSNIRNVDRYSATVSNITRKLYTDMVFTGQRIKQMPPTIRDQLNYRIYPNYNKFTDTLKIFIKYDTGRKESFRILNAVKFITKNNVYNTREKPPTILERDAIREIAKLSKSVKDIQKYLELYTGDKKEKASLLKDILKHKKYLGTKNDDRKSEGGISKDSVVALRRKYNISYDDFETHLGIPHTTASRIVKNYNK